MLLDLSEILALGVSTRLLFKSQNENEVYKNQGFERFRKFQLANEAELLEPVVASTEPERLAPYIDAYAVDLFLSKDSKDLQIIIDSKKCAATVLYAPPTVFNSKDTRVKIAFDADAVLFSDESEFRYKSEGMQAFHDYEKEHVNDPLDEGPFAKLLIKLSKIQEHLPTRIEDSPLRIAIVTARNAPSHMRVIKTLRKWNVYVDEVYFLGGLAKDKVLEAFGAHIFFDDQDTHLIGTSKVVPSGKVPYLTSSPLNKEHNAIN